MLSLKFLLGPSAVQVYSHGGRRLLPAVQLGSPAAFLACDAGWRLLAVTAHGDLHLWDLRAQQCLVEASVRPLLGTAAPHVTGAGAPCCVFLPYPSIRTPSAEHCMGPRSSHATLHNAWCCTIATEVLAPILT